MKWMLLVGLVGLCGCQKSVGERCVALAERASLCDAVGGRTDTDQEKGGLISSCLEAEKVVPGSVSYLETVVETSCKKRGL